eukprot:s4319_g3.t1
MSSGTAAANQDSDQVRRRAGAYTQKTARRLTYNVSGITSELYDTLCHWLQRQQEADIIFLQEMHWGLGRDEATWSVPGWVLQVRCEHEDVCLDLFCVYQWVRSEAWLQHREMQRTQVWTALGRVLSAVPARNLLIVGGDFNSNFGPLRCLVGMGVLEPSERSDPELVALLEAHPARHEVSDETSARHER